MQQIIDITLPLTETTPPFPGDPPLRIEKLLDYSKGDDLSLSKISLSAHLGTHLDAPLHFEAGGISVDQLDLDILIGPASVVEILAEGKITAAQIQSSLPAMCTRLLIKTSRMPNLFPRPTAWLAPEAAQGLVESGVRLIGIDSPSVDSVSQPDAASHRTLLRNNIVIVENLALNEVEETVAELICLPLKVVGLEGAPVRAVLRMETR